MTNLTIYRDRLCWGWVIALACIAAVPNHLRGQDGSLDTSFQSPLFRVPVSLVRVEADGRVLYAVAEDGIHFSVGRLNSDGSPGTTINLGDGPEAISDPIDFGTIHIPGATNPATINVLEPLANGQILVGGSFTHFNKVARKLLVRLNANGSVDSSFNQTNGFQGDYVSTIVEAEGGKLYVGGKFTKFGHSSRNVGLVRLNADGSLDSSFLDSTISFGATVAACTLQPDGKPLIEAAYANASFQATVQVYRLGANGGLDAGFTQGTGTPASTSPLRHGLMANGQILVTGGSGLYNGASVNKALFRLNSNGTPDSSYPGITLELSNIGGLIGRFLPGPNGTMYISGAFDTVNGQTRSGLARLKAHATLDPSFVPAAYISPSPGALALQLDGKILAGSSVIVGVEPKYNIVRLNGGGGSSPHGPQLGTISFLQGGMLRIPVNGEVSSVVIESTSDLTTWQKVATNSVVNGAVSFTDPFANQSNARFYRVLSVQ